MAGTERVPSERGLLPAEVTSFVGRRRELTETRRLLARSRLLTLTGVGGVGKTRLAMRMAAELRRTFPDGVWFVELAALHDPQLVPHSMASALELRQVSADPTADLAHYLERKQLLVVLDNCEHLSDAVAVMVSKLLTAAPGLRVLATSRHVLGVGGEQILVVPPLSTPDGESRVEAGDATHYESVALLLDRAVAVTPEFTISDGNRAAVTELCRRLDGIPLAIELAAVWLRVLSPEQMLDRLADRFRLLTAVRPAVPARQRALDAAIAWSFDLCSPAERLLWARLSVFAGGFDLEAAEAVCSAEGLDRADVLGLLANLVNKSIITRQLAGDHTAARYQMLETIRQYGASRLPGLDSVNLVRTRHRNHYRGMAGRYAAECFGPEQAGWMIRLRREHENVRAALEFCLQEPGQAAAALDIAAPMWNFWFAGFLREGYRYMLQALRLAPEPTPSRAYGLWAASYLAMFATEFDKTAVMLDECRELADRFDDELLHARIKECRGHAMLYHGDLAAAVELLEEARAEFRATGDPLGEFDTLILLSAATFFLDDPRLGEFSQQALALAERHGALSSKAYALWSVGIHQWQAGLYDSATATLRESVRLFMTMNDLTGISFGVQALSWCAAFASPDAAAARLMGASQAVWRTSGAKVDETNAYGMFDQRSAQRIRQAVGEAELDPAFAEGAAYSFEQAVTLALGEQDSSGWQGRGRRSTASTGVLTRREHEIANLLAEGLTNKDIATRLVISLRTVESHVDHILSKLGMTSRAQVASWLAEQSRGDPTLGTDRT